MTKAIDDLVKRSRAAQGLPPEVTDPRVLQGVRAIIAEHLDRLAREDVLPLVEPCYRCGRPVYQLRHERTGRVALIEAEPDPTGDVLVDLDAGTYRRWSGGTPRQYEEHSGRWHVRHEAGRCRPGR